MIHIYWIEPTLNPSSISVDSSPKNHWETILSVFQQETKLRLSPGGIRHNLLRQTKTRTGNVLKIDGRIQFTTLKSVINPYPKVSTKSSPSNTRNYPTQDQRPVSISHKSLGKLKYPIIFRQAYLFLYLDLSGNRWTTHHPDILSCTQSYLCIDLKQLIDI